VRYLLTYQAAAVKERICTFHLFIDAINDRDDRHRGMQVAGTLVSDSSDVRSADAFTYRLKSADFRIHGLVR